MELFEWTQAVFSLVSGASFLAEVVAVFGMDVRMRAASREKVAWLSARMRRPVIARYWLQAPTPPPWVELDGLFEAQSHWLHSLHPRVTLRLSAPRPTLPAASPLYHYLHWPRTRDGRSRRTGP